MYVDFPAVAAFVVTIPLTVGIVLYRKLAPAGKYLTLLLVSWFTAELFSYVLRVNGYENWTVYFLLSFAEIVLVTMFYKQIYSNRHAKSIIVWIAWIGIAIVPSEFAIANGPDNTVTMFFECTFFIVMGLYALYEGVFQKSETNYTLVVGCLMIFFLGSAVYFSTWRFMKYDEALFRLFGHVHGVLLIACYLAFSVSLWRLRLSY
jgi:hypothetical protein